MSDCFLLLSSRVIVFTLFIFILLQTEYRDLKISAKKKKGLLVI